MRSQKGGIRLRKSKHITIAAASLAIIITISMLLTTRPVDAKSKIGIAKAKAAAIEVKNEVNDVEKYAGKLETKAVKGLQTAQQFTSGRGRVPHKDLSKSSILVVMTKSGWHCYYRVGAEDQNLIKSSSKISESRKEKLIAACRADLAGKHGK